MRIAFLIIGNTDRGGDLNGETIRYGKVGSSGTDSSAILVAEYLASQGHEVVFAKESCAQFVKIRGVVYTNVNFDTITNKTFDVLVTALWFERFSSLNIKVTKALVYWCHLAWMYSMREMADFANAHGLKFGVVHVSEWERNHNKDTVEFMKNTVRSDTTSIVIPNAIMIDVAKPIIEQRIEKKSHQTIFHTQWSRGGPTALEAVKRLGWDVSNFVSFDYLKTSADDRLDKRTLFIKLAESEYFLFPSFTHGRLVYKDTFSCAVAEALLMGVIVVAYRLGALPEYYNDYCVWVDYPAGVNLQKIQSERVSEEPLFGNVDNMVAKVKYLENNPDIKKKFTVGREYILTNFCIEKIGPTWERYLLSIV